MVKSKLFNTRVLYVEALVIGQFVATLSLLFLEDIKTMKIIVILLVILSAVFGYLLISSAMNEVRQRKQLRRISQKLAEQNKGLKEIDRVKSEFLSIASHQLRSPLTAIRGYASMMLEGSFGEFPEKSRVYLERIDESSKFMADSIEDYLNVSRIESGNMHYSHDDFNLCSLVEKVTEELKPVAARKKLNLELELHVSSDCMINADKSKVYQALHNLTNNAIKYTPEGSIKVDVREHVDKKKIWVDIKDSGIGMEEKIVERLFEKFSRAEHASSYNISGTGLGLYVARQMVEHMGGTITAYSEGLGKGSTFTVTLPLKE